MILRALAAVVTLFLSSCASHKAHNDSPTGGLELTMFVRDATGAEALYRVDRDGMLSFGGGLQARFENPSWTGPMTTQEIDQLREMLRSVEWYKSKLHATGKPEGQLYRVALAASEGSRKFSFKGEHAHLKPVRELLESASKRRLERDLQRLPQPSLQRILDATTAPATQPH